MRDVIIVHGSERAALLAAILVRARLRRGTFVQLGPDTLLHYFESRAIHGRDVAVHVVGIRPRERDCDSLIRQLQGIARAAEPVRWFDVGAWPEALRGAVLHACHPESAIDISRVEPVSLVRDQLSMTGPLAENLIRAASRPVMADNDPQLIPWLLALDTAAAGWARLPGYLPALMARLSNGIPAHLGPIDEQAANAGRAEWNQRFDRAAKTVTRVFTAGPYRLVVADERLDRGLTWKIILQALTERGTPEGPADIQLVVCRDGSLKVAARNPQQLDIEARLQQVGPLPVRLQPSDSDGVLSSPPLIVGAGHGHCSEAVAAVVSGLAWALGGAGWQQPELALRTWLAQHSGQPVDLRPLDDQLLESAGPAARAAKLALYQVTWPADADNEAGLVALVQEPVGEQNDGWREALWQDLLELQANAGFSRLYLRAPDGRYGAIEALRGAHVVSIDPVSVDEAPRPWDAGHVRTRALHWERWPRRILDDIVRLVRVNPDLELDFDATAVRLFYRGIRLMEVRPRGGLVGLEGALAADGASVQIFRSLGPQHLARIAPLKRKVDAWLTARGPGRASAMEIASKMVADTRRAAEAGYWIVARDVTFPGARHMRLDLLAVNRTSHRLTAVHIATPGTAEFTRAPLRALRQMAWLAGPRLDRLVQDAENILAQKAVLGLSGYQPVRIVSDAEIPIETAVAVVSGHRTVSRADELMFARIAELLDPPGGLHLLDVPDWYRQPAVLRSNEPLLDLSTWQAA